jgi:hypothetical protein
MSCENNTLDLSPDKLTVKKKIGDTLSFSVTFTDDDGSPINLTSATPIDYYFAGSILAGLGTGITVSTNNVTITKIITGEQIGNFTHKLVITMGGVTRTYFDGYVKIEA